MDIGKSMPQIILPAIDGAQFDSQALKGKKYLVTFFRFATCPFCNMRIAELIRVKEKLGEGFEIIAIFESELEHLKNHTNKYIQKFPILADNKRKYYKLFGVRKSILGLLKGMVFRFPTIIKASFKGYFPREISLRYLTMPLSILVDAQGKIQTIYYGRDEGDHLPLEKIIAFSQEGD